MGTGSATIDLGELPRGEPPEIEPPPWPIRHRLRRIRARQTRWALAHAALAVLLLTTAAAAAAPSTPRMSLEFVVPGTAFAVSQETLYAVDQGTLTAYRLADGTVRWRRTVPDRFEFVSLAAHAGALFLTAGSESSGAQTTRFDPNRGEPLWTRAGYAAGLAGPRLMLIRDLPAGGEDGVPTQEITAVDIDTGAPVWTITAQTWNVGTLPDGSEGLATVAADGRLATYDLETGEPRGSGSAATPVEWALPVLVGSMLIVQSVATDRTAITAYRPETLSQMWTVEDLESAMAPCGDMVCLLDHASVRALDPATGEQLWSMDEMPDVGVASWIDVIEPAAPALDGYAVVARGIGSGVDEMSFLIDLATGELVLDLGRWSVLPGYGLSVDPVPDPMVLMWRKGNEVWFGRLRPDLSGVDPLGSMEIPIDQATGLPPNCTVAVAHVVCGHFPWAQVEAPAAYVWHLR